MKFNPPPNWPEPPAGWTPPPDWEPDPSWPQPPVGWQLWVDEDEVLISPTHVVRRRGTRLPWYRRTAAVVLFLIVFFPFGLVLLWMRPDWSARRRGVITAVVAVLVVIIGASHSSQPAATNQLSSAAGSAKSSASASGSASASAAVSPSAQAPKSASPVARVASAAPKTSAPAVVAPPPAPPVVPATTTKAAPPPPAPTTHAPPPPPPSTQAAPPQPSTCGAPSNPYGYNLCGNGGFVTSPPSDICRYFGCIDNFWNGRGYMVECRDGEYSMSGGIRGACSYHGGEEQAVSG